MDATMVEMSLLGGISAKRTIDPNFSTNPATLASISFLFTGRTVNHGEGENDPNALMVFI